MKRIIIEGQHQLSGEITIGGAKNGAVAIIPAALLCDETVTIDNIPNISDTDALIEILKYLGAKVKIENKTMTIDSSLVSNKEIPADISSRLRASYYFMAALLSRFKETKMLTPGGCVIGKRPIDQTLKGFEALGAEIIEDNSSYTITAKELIGNHIYLDMPSVGATVNILLVAVKAEGETIIENAAREPEIVNLATFLNNMGGQITGAGTSEIRIIGVKKLKGCYIEVIPDRIEAGSYIIAGALAGKDLKICNIIPEHDETLILKLMEMGVNIKVNEDSVIVSKGGILKPTNIKTLGYPGFPTDLQQPITSLLITCKGNSHIAETIYENRFQNIPYLNKLGANITVSDDNKVIEICGPSRLIGTEINATDLRAGASLVLAALIAEGTTIINNAEYILRGYENIINKLCQVGAKIKIEDV